MTQESEKTWFEKMAGYLVWKIMTPDLSNPFRPHMSDKSLQELTENEDRIKKLLDIKCFCDGYEILTLKNYLNPKCVTDHPSLTKVTVKEVMNMLEVQGVTHKIDEELKKVKEGISDELVRRNHERERTAALKKRIEEVKKAEVKKKKLPPVESQFRVMRKGR